MRIAIAASGRLGATVTRPLLQTRHEVVALIQDGRQTKGIWRPINWIFSYLGGADNMLAIARRNRMRVVYIDKMTEAELAPLRALNIDLLLVSGFAIILKKPLLQLPRIGCINMHSSLLPRHRGPNPFSAAIVQGDTHTGVTFHVMEEGIDTGDILDQSTFEIEPRDEMMTVYRKACEVAGQRIVEVIEYIDNHGLVGTPQDPALATYDPKLTEKDAWIDWGKSAIEIDRMIRGFSPATMPRFRFKDDTIYVAKSTPHPEPVDAAPGTVISSGNPLRIATGAGSLDLHVAFCRKPVPWVWPSPFSRPVTGERLGTP